VDAARRAELKRYAAPAAFLAAVTVAVLLVKAGLNGGGSPNTEPTVPTVVPSTTRARRTTRTTTAAATATTAARYYTIQSGDTLGVVAAREHTTVADLLRLNPGVDPTGLHVGQRIRVG
jgi:LysM repeat protein